MKPVDHLFAKFVSARVIAARRLDAVHAAPNTKNAGVVAVRSSTVEIVMMGRNTISANVRNVKMLFVLIAALPIASGMGWMDVTSVLS